MNEQEKKVAQNNEVKKEGEQSAKKEQPKKAVYHGVHPEQLHCRRCQTLMENGTCPACGFKIYVPMSDEKRKKIKTITTAIGFVVFIVIFLIIQFSKS